MADAALASSAFAGFRLLARRPLTFLVWGLGALAVWAAVLGALFAASPGGFGIHLFGPIGAPVLWLTATILICAVFRLVLRTQERHRIGLRIGPDELRLAPLVLVLGAIAAVCILPLVLSGPQRLAATAILLLISPFLCLLAPAVFATRRLDLLQGFRLAWRRYASLLAMNLLIAGIYATTTVLLGHFWKWMILVNDTRIDQAIHRGTGAVGQMIGIAGVLAILIYGALLIIVTAPAAEAYRRLTSPPAPGP
ncbi:lysylphosphatidylglycerol synthetase-like protein (DUF2156 family) [Caulobacter ginsengisoli]|uniref:Lysylphosphatidylglycerol synthetase-like protein (DUF2156 family) n=1 Tax=Caulobacter ginsengisoli TaxID=400775 RepID=A0ABU0IM26_9CAUL|nr:hypothetical protein [Caulobacter ginsengisoli]MDQ0463057.1 lysylphosphatidylglycerol synthetase-like protein (DUF2156 family) [Caulobacter ginsengisoli]